MTITTFLTKKSCYASILTLFIGLVLWVVPFSVLASEIFIDDFETYTIDERLNTQGGWISSSPNEVWVIGDKFQSGDQAINSNIVSGINTNKPPVASGSITEGIFSFYFYLTKTTSDQYLSTHFWKAEAPYFLFSGPNVSCGGSNCTISYWEADEWHLIKEISINEWHYVGLDLNFTTGKFKYKIDTDNWSSEHNTRGTGTIDYVNLYLGSNVYVDNFGGAGPPPAGPTFDITEPESGSTITENFDIIGDYNKAEESWIQKTMVIFEEWDASSTCPVAGTSEFTEEYQKGWFHKQSFPYFSPLLTEETASTTIPISELSEGNYNCVRCYFINEDTNQIGPELCPDYTLIISNFLYPEGPEIQIPFTAWDTYYSAHTDEKFASSTAIFITLAETTNLLFQKFGNFYLYFSSLFDANLASAKGTELGTYIPQARSYLIGFDDFLGGFPLSTILIFFFTTLLVIVLYNIIKGLLHLIRG